MFKVIIAGGRDFNDYSLLKDKCGSILRYKNIEKLEIVSGTAKGADQLGERFAKEHHIKVKRFPADWNNIDTNDPCIIKYAKQGKAYNALAGYSRNKQMSEYSNALILFWDEVSNGSKSMLSIAKKDNLLIRIIRY